MRHLAALTALLVFAPALEAQQRSQAGPIINSAGAVFSVPSPTFANPTDGEYKVAFELRAPASQPDRLNQSFNTVARFLNMHAQAGVPLENISAAAVVHGGAAFELLDDEAYRERNGVDNPNRELILELVEKGYTVVLCGQSAASRGIAHEDLIPGVQVALSAMTAFVVLQEQGYKVNPW